MIKRFLNYVRLYGFSVAIQRVIKAILYKLFRFTWDKSFLMSRENDKELPLTTIIDLSIKLLVPDDLFSDSLWQEYYGETRQFIEHCFNLEYARPYGFYIGDRLAYVTWILYNHIEYEGKFIDAPGCAMQWNAYCLSEFRGRGLHSYGKSWTVNEMMHHGVKKCYASTLSYNRPALKTQKKLGFKVEKTFYIIICGGKKCYKLIS